MAQVAVCSQINTKHINTVWAERTVVESLTGGASRNQLALNTLRLGYKNSQLMLCKEIMAISFVISTQSSCAVFRY